MRQILAVILLMALGALGMADSDTPFKYYNLDNVTTVTGTIVDITTQRSYHKHDFVMIRLATPGSDTVYNVEVCPQWFFQLDLMKGMELEVTGSVAMVEGQNFMMTRSLRYSGELFNFRDTNGFPLWRGQAKTPAQGKGAQRRRQGRR